MELCFVPGDGIPVRPMPQVAEALVDGEDWTGTTSAKERRKLQNRLNQRARRRKQRQQAEDPSRNQGDPSPLLPREDSRERYMMEEEGLEFLSIDMGKLFLVSRGEIAIAIRQRGRSKPYLIKTGHNSPDAIETCNHLSRIAQELYRRNSIGQPRHGHLTTIVHFNVFHGLARNAMLLGLHNQWLIKGTTSPFSRSGASPPPLYDGDFASFPANMQPTRLQRTVTHHPWIDLLPLPRMRDNFLRAAAAVKQGSLHDKTIDEDSMCRDIVDVGAGHGIEHAAMVIWGDAWDPGAWEATEGFLKKWGWLLEGCTEMLDGTNRWRLSRGLKPFKFRVT